MSYYICFSGHAIHYMLTTYTKIYMDILNKYSSLRDSEKYTYSERA
jgi:hypothetical protein